MRTDELDFVKAGLAAKERRQFVAAIRLFDEAPRQGGLTDEVRGYVFYSRGVAHEALGNAPPALEDFNAAIALLPTFPNSYIYRGLLRASRQEYDWAIADFGRLCG